MKKWNPKSKPDTAVCPEQFCFHWVPPGGAADLSGREYDSAEAAIDASNRWTTFPEGGCAFRPDLGKCMRNDIQRGLKDVYEPHEPNLDDAGLPWFYFTTKESLAEEFHEDYDRDSEAWWNPE